MYFEYPKLLWLLVVPGLLVVHYIWLELAKRHPHLRVSTSVPWLVKRNPLMSVLRHVPFVLRTFALTMIVIAIARPRSAEQMEKIDTEGIDIILAMDVSTSMLARDLTPDRISASKDIAIEFISQRPSDRMGIVVFAGESFTQCPLTTDRATLINLMKEVQTDLIEDGTAIYTPQNHEAHTYAKMLRKELGKLDFTEPAEKLERYIRGLNPWPSAYTYKDGKTMKFWSASVSYEKFEPCPCGTLVSVKDGMLWIMTGDGILQVKELQPEGKRRMTTEEYLRGYPLTPGMVFGS